MGKQYSDNIICSKAAKRLHFLKLLKRSGVVSQDLLLYYKTVIRPVMEYACLTWQSSITNGQIDDIDAIQRRALNIINSNSNNQSISVTPLKERRQHQAKRFFKLMLSDSNSLHNVLPAVRDKQLINRLRNPYQRPVPFARTERYKRSFITNALANYQ